MNKPTNEEIEGYTLYSNYVKDAIGHTFESFTEKIQKELYNIPLEKIIIKLNPYQGGFSVYLHNDYAYVCDNLRKLVEFYFEVYKDLNKNNDPTTKSPILPNL